MIKKKITKYYWEIYLNNKAFFMPTIVAFIVIFTSFVVWQTYEVLVYAKLEINYANIVNYDSAKTILNNHLTKNIQQHKNSKCYRYIIDRTIYSKEQFKLTTNGYCISVPNIKDEEFINVVRLIKQIKQLKDGNDELKEQQYKKKENNLTLILKEELEKNLIGPPIDIKELIEMETNPELIEAELLKQKIISKMEKILIYNNEISINKKTIKILIIYSLKTSKIQRIFYNY